MKQKNKKTLATLVTAVVILLGGYIYQSDGTSLFDTTHSTKIQSNSTEDIQKSAKSRSGSKKDNVQIDKKQSGSEKDNTQSTKNQSGSAKNTEILEKTTFPESIITIQSEGIAPFGYINASVEKVVDGDTFHIKYKNQEYKVRMLDIDTPESVKSGVDAQPYAIEASDFTKATLKDKNVKLVFEKDTTDKYGRLLAHIILKDGTYYNAMMVQNGYAISVFYNPNTLFKEYFTELQNKAIDNKSGFWQLPESERPFIMNSKGKYIAAYKLKADAA